MVAYAIFKLWDRVLGLVWCCWGSRGSMGLLIKALRVVFSGDGG